MAMLPRLYRAPESSPLGMWQSSAQVAVMESLHRAQVAHDHDQRRRWQVLRDYLDGLHEAHAQAQAAASLPHRAREWAKGNGHAYRYHRLVQLIAERLAVVFFRPPELYLHDGSGTPLTKDHPVYGPQVQQWEDDREDAELDTLLSHIDMSVRVLGQQVVIPSWISDGDHQRIEWVSYDPQDVLVHQSETDPSNIAVARAVSVAIRQPSDTIGGIQPVSYSTWTRDVDPETRETTYRHWCHRADGTLLHNPLFPDASNAYRMIPAVLWQVRRPASGEVYVPPDEALIQAQASLDVSLTDLAWMMRSAAFPQRVLKGQLRDGTTPVFGPDRLIWLDDEGSLESQTPDVPLAEVRQTIEWFLRMEAVSRSLPPDILDPSAARNLAALQEQRHELWLERERSRPHYERALKKTFAVHKRVGNTAIDLWGAPRVRYSDEVQLGIRLAPVPRVEDPWQAAQARMLQVSQGVASAVEDVMDQEGVSREEATRRVMQRVSESRMVAAAEPPRPGQAPAPAKAPGDTPRPASVERG